MTFDERTINRRAIEALRAGVPNQDAVRSLGSSQPELELKFRAQLEVVKSGACDDSQAAGMLITGGFGSGKSHILEFFKHIALEANFVCSKIVISKETPLYDPAKVYRAAVETANVPGRRGTGMTNIAASLNFESPTYRDFYEWVQNTGRGAPGKNTAGLSQQFAASVYLYEYARRDDEIRDRINRFWSGDPLNTSELKRYLRDMKESVSYKIARTPVRELAMQRFFFTPRLIRAAGYAGWVFLVDEVELIGRYSLRQRARSYAELARMLGKVKGAALPGILSVLTISDDFEAAVFDDPRRNDEEKIPARYGQSDNPADTLLASQAQRGMRLIRNEKSRLSPLTPVVVRNTFDKLRLIYAASGWEPPLDYREPQLATSAVIRPIVKKWITEWDLERFYPGYRPDIETTALRPDYAETPELEEPEEGEPDVKKETDGGV